MSTAKNLVEQLLHERMTFKQLMRYAEPRRVLRSQTVRGGPLKIDTFEDSVYHSFNFKSFPSTTGLRHHGYIKFFKPRSPRNMEDLECVVDCTCFAGDTLVLMSDGVYKPISEVVPGDQVYTHKGRIRRVLGNVERELKPGERAYQVKVEGFPYPVTVTGDHPYYALRGAEKCRCGCGKTLPDISGSHSYSVARLNRGYAKGHHPVSFRTPSTVILKVLADSHAGVSARKIAAKYGIGKSTVLNIIRGKTATRDDRPPAKVGFSWVKVNDFQSREWFLSPWLDPGSTSMNLGLARFIGYYAAEGCLGKSDFAQFSLHLSEEKTLAKDLIALARGLLQLGIGFRIPNKYRGKQGEFFHLSRCNTKKFKRPMKAVALTLAVTKEFRKYLDHHVGKGAHHKRLSPELMQLNGPAAQELLTGMFLGDGHIRKNGTFRWSSVSSALTWQISTLLNRLHVRHVVNPWGKRRGLDRLAIDVNHPESCKKIFSWLFPYLRPHQKKRACQKSDNLSHVVDQGCLRALKSREPSGYAGTVWDLSVEEDESFVVQGVAVHNCPDFKYRWAWPVKQKGSSVVGPRSMNRAWNQATRHTNPSAIPGLCKHLIALKDYITGLASDRAFGQGSDDNSGMMRALMRYADNRWTATPEDGQDAREREAALQSTRLLRNRGQLPSNAPVSEPVEAPAQEAPEAPELEAGEAPRENPTTSANPQNQPNQPNGFVAPDKGARRGKRPSGPPTAVGDSVDKFMKHVPELRLVEELIAELDEQPSAPKLQLADNGSANELAAEAGEESALGYLRQIRDFLADIAGAKKREAPAEAPEDEEPGLPAGAPPADANSSYND